MSLDYDRNFSKLDGSIKSRDSGQDCGPVSVRQVTVKQSGRPKDNNASQPHADEIHKRDRNQRLEALSLFLCVLHVLILLRDIF